MNKMVITILYVLAFIGGFFIFYQIRLVQEQITADSQQTSATQKWETKTEEQASVTVVVTPLDLSSQSAEWKFDITLSTHSVELDQDMIEVAILTDDSGKEHSPARWEGTPAGGHHREGVLVFSPITPTPKSVELKIIGIADVIRILKWEL